MKEKNNFATMPDHMFVTSYERNAGYYYIGDDVYRLSVHLRKKPFFIHIIMMRLFFGIKWKDNPIGEK